MIYLCILVVVLFAAYQFIELVMEIGEWLERKFDERHEKKKLK